MKSRKKTYEGYLEEKAIEAMKDLLFPLRLYNEWTSVSERDPRWLTVQKHLWNSRDSIEAVIGKAGEKEVRCVKERTAGGDHLVFLRYETDYAVVQSQFLAHAKEEEERIARGGGGEKEEELFDECCCEETIMGGYRAWQGVVLLAIILALGYLIFAYD